MTYLRPGVYPSDVSTPGASSSGPAGRITAAIGTAPKGSSNPGDVVYTSLGDFIRDYGDPASSPGYSLPLAAQAYFNQAGEGQGVAPALVVKRIGTALATITVPGSSGQLVLKVLPQYAGTAGNGCKAVAAAQVWVASSSAYMQQITITDPNGFSDPTYTVYDSSTTGANTFGLFASQISQNSGIVSLSSYTNGAFATAGTYTGTGGSDGLGAQIQQSDVDSLQPVPCDFVVALQGDMPTIQMVQAHCLTMSANFAKPRKAVAGFSVGTTVAQIITNLGTLADATGRTWVAGHDAVRIFNPSTQAVQTLDGFYLAMIIAAIKAATPPQYPLLGRRVLNVQGVNQRGQALSDSQLDTIAAAGGIVLELGPNGLEIEDGPTTSATSPYKYPEIRDEEDELVKLLKAGITARIKGQPGGPTLKQRIEGEGNADGLQAVNNGWIAFYGPNTASQDTQDPSKWTLSVTYGGRVGARIIAIPLTVSLS